MSIICFSFRKKMECIFNFYLNKGPLRQPAVATSPIVRGRCQSAGFTGSPHGRAPAQAGERVKSKKEPVRPTVIGTKDSAVPPKLREKIAPSLKVCKGTRPSAHRRMLGKRKSHVQHICSHLTQTLFDAFREYSSVITILLYTIRKEKSRGIGRFLIYFKSFWDFY
jgi:hypothetical protein